jgi:choice-of-anchor C domain-containing protein
MKRNLFAALLLVISFVLIRETFADLLVNGGFETPTQGPPLFATFNIPAGSTYITGWTVVQGNVDLTNTCCYGPLLNTLDPTSTQAVDLIGDNRLSAGVFGGLSQTFATVPGQQYQLTFDYSHNPGVPSPDFYAAQVTVADAHVPANTVFSGQVSQANGPAPWVAFSQTFTANSDSTLLTFIDTHGAFDAGIYLDDVSVTPLAAGVPDSGSTGAMMLLGVLGVGFLAHRWRNSLCA